MNAGDPNQKHNEGLCLVCAKELGISQVDDYIKSMGISEDEIQAMSEQLMELTDGNDFELGGSGTMPSFLSSLFGGAPGEPQDNGISAEPIKNRGAAPKNSDAKGDKKKKLKFLTNYCTNLTERAREGKLDNIVGRDKEISRVIHILSRRQKNNPCLIGGAGRRKNCCC